MLKFCFFFKSNLLVLIYFGELTSYITHPLSFQVHVHAAQTSLPVQPGLQVIQNVCHKALCVTVKKTVITQLMS